MRSSQERPECQLTLVRIVGSVVQNRLVVVVLSCRPVPEMDPPAVGKIFRWNHTEEYCAPSGMG